MVSLNISTEPNFIRPELLLHPSIPLALSGVNPRTIKGKEWWDTVRKVVYATNNHCCWACGVYQLDAPYKHHLEAHETYTYDYEKFEAYPEEVVGLCRACHWFIHWRRLRIPRLRKEVVIRGLKILAEAGLPVPSGQRRYADKLDWDWREGIYQNLKIQEGPTEAVLLSKKWKLILENGGV